MKYSKQIYLQHKNTKISISTLIFLNLTYIFSPKLIKFQPLCLILYIKVKYKKKLTNLFLSNSTLKLTKIGKIKFKI